MKTIDREFLPRLIALEVTRRCTLNCKHCRASAGRSTDFDALPLEACIAILDDIASFASPTIILTGGEPMLRDDLYDIVRHGRDLGLRMVMGTCGIFITPENVHRLKECGILRIGISIDGASPESHDSFRGVPGSFEGALRATKIARQAGLEFQINTTITRANVAELPEILELAIAIGAVAFNPFFLVPIGRGRNLVEEQISDEEYERTLLWIYEQTERCSIHLKPTCAPHYFRIRAMRQRERGRGCILEIAPADQPEEAPCISANRKTHVGDARHGVSYPDSHAIRPPHAYQVHSGVSQQESDLLRSRKFIADTMDFLIKGCMGGQSFAFISHLGKVQTCGFLELECGDVRKQNFSEIWRTSEIFLTLRNPDNLRGKCGICEYRRVCGGCRARAFALSGDYLGEEPYCIHVPERGLPR